MQCTMTAVAAVHDGYLLHKSVTVNPVGGRVLTSITQKVCTLHSAVRKCMSREH
jgi:hypothetical protein